MKTNILQQRHARIFLFNFNHGNDKIISELSRLSKHFPSRVKAKFGTHALRELVDRGVFIQSLVQLFEDNVLHHTKLEAGVIGSRRKGAGGGHLAELEFVGFFRFLRGKPSGLDS